jgi:dihydropteroate synthase
LGTPAPSRTDAGTAGDAPVGPRRAHAWRTAAGLLPLDRPRVMGVLNLTPDSFWAESRRSGADEAVEAAGAMVEAGAAILDVGGESTRPGAAPIDAAEEIRRVVGVIDALARAFPRVPISVDTVKSATARAALDAGAAIVNDVSGLRLDPAIADAARDAGAGLVLMHSRGGVGEMASYALAEYGGSVAGEVIAELEASLRIAAERGVAREAVALDPGLGFAKTTEHSVAVLRDLTRLADLGHPVVVGPSRKRFIGELGSGTPAAERLSGTLAACVVAYLRGARIFRVHDVAETVRALAVAAALASDSEESKGTGA